MKKLEINQILYDIHSKLKKIEGMESQEDKPDIQLLVDISNTQDRIKKITENFKEKYQLTSMIYVPLVEKLQDADKLDIGLYKKERTEIRIKSIEKQEDKLKEKAEALRAEVMEDMNKKEQKKK